MLEVKNLSFAYGQTPVLQNVSAVFEPCNIYGVIGPNGSGKTTLLHLISRLLTPKSGKITLKNRDIFAFSPREYAQKAAILPQNRPVPDITVEELVSFGRYPYGRFSESDKKFVDTAISQANINDLRHRDLKSLSGGQQQKAHLAMLLAQDADILLLDEPTTFLDISAQLNLINTLKFVKSRTKTIISVFHDIPLALRACDKLLVLKDGRVQAFASPEDLVQTNVLKETFGVQFRRIILENQENYIFFE